MPATSCWQQPPDNDVIAIRATRLSPVTTLRE
jgi:hypothetical protein